MSLIQGKKIRLALLDDHPIVLKGFEVFLHGDPDIELSGSFRESHELFGFLKCNEIDVLVLDYLLGDNELDGLQLIRRLVNYYPTMKIVMSSTVENSAVVRLALRFGVHGYVAKSSQTDDIVRAIKTVYRGGIWLSENMRYEMSLLDTSPFPDAGDDTDASTGNLDNLNRLTARESEVLRHFLDGMTVMQIAAKFRRSRKTVSGQKQTAMKKLGIKSDAELFTYRNFIL